MRKLSPLSCDGEFSPVLRLHSQLFPLRYSLFVSARGDFCSNEIEVQTTLQLLGLLV